jgi:hypothetical protein
MICAESGEGCVCVRHASEKVVSVVGASAMTSKGLKRFECAFVCEVVGQWCMVVTGKRNARARNLSRYPRRERS